MGLKKYYALARNSFRESTAYRLDAVTTLLSSIVFLVLYFAVWTAIDSSGEIDGGLSQVLTYLVAGQVVSNAAFIQTEKFVGERVRKGTVVNELKRPLGFMSHVYFHELGHAVFNIGAKALPVLAMGALFLDVPVPGPLQSLYFALSVFLAFNLVFLVAYTNSMLVFWTKVDWSLRMTRSTVQNLFSGVLFPLYLLPSGLETAFSLLPFRAMADSPIQVFLGNVSGTSLLGIYGIQIFWIIVFFVISRLAWSKARNKLTVQGG